MISSEPSAFPPAPAPSASNTQPWWWQLLDDAGAVVVPAGGREEFPTRSDAESWLGETWSDLADDGVAAVTLFEGEREAYGPMPLSAE